MFCVQLVFKQRHYWNLVQGVEIRDLLFVAGVTFNQMIGAKRLTALVFCNLIWSLLELFEDSSFQIIKQSHL